VFPTGGLPPVEVLVKSSDQLITKLPGALMFLLLLLASSISFIVKNDDSVTLPAGTPVYSYGADGTNILVRRCVSHTGDSARLPRFLAFSTSHLRLTLQGLVTQVGQVAGH
jgi:hypothetical protein